MVNSHWMSAVTGLHYLKEGLECFCDDVVKKQHTDLKAKCLRPCTECRLDTLEPDHNCNILRRCPLGQRNCNCLKRNQTIVQCPNRTCGGMYDEIINMHGSTPPAPNWMNTDITQWYSNPWAIATCCIKANGYRGRTRAADCDCSGLLSVITNDKAFLGHLDCNIDGEDPFSKAREIRNKLFHSPSLKIAKEEAHSYISVMIDALQDGKELFKRKEARDAVEKLKKLMKCGFGMYQNIEMVKEVQSLERITSIESSLQNLSKRRTDNKIPYATYEKSLKDIGLQLSELVLHMYERKEVNATIATKDSELKGGVLEAVKTGDHSRAISLLVRWLENICSLEQNDDKSVQTQYRMPRLRRPHDGRLITLTKEDVTGILYNCDTVLGGSFGDAHVSAKEVPGLDLRVVIKKIEIKGDEVIKMLSVSNEKIASRVMHFAIVPLIGYMDETKDDKGVFYFLSPYLEKGNLQKAIARDKLCSDIKGIQLEQQRRITILLQIASALEYLHTPVPNYRGIVLHMDLTSTNIVLDSFKNARVIDFGLARELNEGQTKASYARSQCLGTPGYCPTSRDSKLTVHDDYYNFGIVIRELLTGVEPYIKDAGGASELRKFDGKFINKKLQRNIWNGSKHVEDIVSLSTKCLISKTENLSAAKIVKTLEPMHIRPTYFTTAEEKKCHMCMVNPAVTGPHSSQDQHGCGMKVCVSCMRNSHINPIKCPICNKGFTPKIGHTTAALLIAGNDIEDAEFAKSFTNEIKEIKDVLVSKYPCVIGCSEENVRTVTPSTPGQAEELRPNLHSEIDYLKSRKGLETLILYYTGHYFEASGFQLGGPEEKLKLESLQKDLMQISEEWESQARMIVVLDCCFPPSVARSIQIRSNASLKVLQINVCGPTETSDQPVSGSIFQKFFIQALTRRSFNMQCYNTIPNTGNECEDCEMTGDFISIEKLLEYISVHMWKKWNRQEPVTYTHGITWPDVIIGYNVDFVIDYKVKFGEQDVDLPLRIVHNIKDLKKSILENVKTDTVDEHSKVKLTPVEFSDAIALRVNKGTVDGQELLSMLNVSSAMDGKREIAVSYRTVSNIFCGPVVLFVHTKRIIEYLNDKKFDGKKLLEQKDKRRKIATLSFLELDDVTSDMGEIPDLEEIHNCLVKVEEKWDKEKNKDNMQLNVVFPCIPDDKFHDFMMLHITTQPEC